MFPAFHMGRVLTKRNLESVISATVQVRPWKFYMILLISTGVHKKIFSVLWGALGGLRGIWKRKNWNSLTPYIWVGPADADCVTSLSLVKNWYDENILITVKIENPLSSVYFGTSQFLTRDWKTPNNTLSISHSPFPRAARPIPNA